MSRRGTTRFRPTRTTSTGPSAPQPIGDAEALTGLEGVVAGIEQRGRCSISVSSSGSPIPTRTESGALGR